MSSAKLKSNHTVEFVEGKELEDQQKNFTGYEKGLVRLHPGRWLLPKAYLKYADKIYNYKFRGTDVLISTYPKCGTNWTQEIVWTMVHNPNLNHPMANVPVVMRAPFIEADMLMGNEFKEDDPILDHFKKLCPGLDPIDGIFLPITETVPDPRIIKTHLSFTVIPPSIEEKCKVVYVTRNPKDVLVSYYHHSCLINIHGYCGTFDQFLQYFIQDDLVYGSYWEHLKEGLARKDHKNVLLLFYEDLKSDPVKEYKKVNEFLGTGLTDEQIQAIIKYTSFSVMKEREENAMSGTEMFNKEHMAKEGGFFRKGVSGSWKAKITEEQNAKLDNWISEMCSDLNIELKYGN